MSRFSRAPLPLCIAVLGATLGTAPAGAQQVAREQDITNLRLGQRVLVDDGTCPAGQIKAVSGAHLTSSGVARETKCVPRVNKK